MATRYGSENVALLLIDNLRPTQLSQLDFNKMLALHHACKCKIEKAIVVERLIDKYRLFSSTPSSILDDVLCKKDKFDNTILDLAIKENHLRIVETLLKIDQAMKFKVKTNIII
jgi:ankyrin repeat protein